MVLVAMYLEGEERPPPRVVNTRHLLVWISVIPTILLKLYSTASEDSPATSNGYYRFNTATIFRKLLPSMKMFWWMYSLQSLKLDCQTFKGLMMKKIAQCTVRVKCTQKFNREDMLLEICRLKGKNSPLFDSDIITAPKRVAQIWTLILRAFTLLLVFTS